MWILLSLSVFFGSLIRITGLNVVPAALFGDEIDVGYQAYSLLHTGRDIYNQVLPTYIKSLSEPRAPLYIYASVPMVAFFGLNEWGVRLTPAIFGILSILSGFYLTLAITKSKRIAVFAASSLAFMPWQIQYSRAGFEVTLLFVLVTLGTIFLFRKKNWLAYIFLGLCFYTYSTAVVLVPLIILAYWVLQKPKIISKGLLVFIILLLPFVWQTVRGQTDNRFGKISILNEPDIAAHITLYNGFGMPKIFNNRYLELGKFFVTNYLQAFSPSFLLVRGDPNVRQSIQFTGELFPVAVVFLVLGLVLAWQKKQWFVLAWLAIAPVASAMTMGGGDHATRLFLMTLPLAIILAFGIDFVLQKNKYIFAGLLVIWFYLFVQTSWYYIKIYPTISWRWWEVGFKDSMQQVAQNSGQYNRIFINNTYEPSLERFLFWTAYSPQKFHQFFTIDQPINNIVTNYNGFSLDGKYFFGDFSKKDWFSTLLPNSLYVVSQRDNVGGDWDWRKSPPGEIKVLYTATNLQNEPIFYLVTRK